MSLSNITLSASVRQNLLSLQGTADLLATTQNRLATGKKVNSALDNPTNFFTAAGLDARASDIGNLLDSIGNGVQVLQAANTGITSLSKLVDTAKSIANQALQQPGRLQHQEPASSFIGATAAGLARPPPRTSTARSVARLVTCSTTSSVGRHDHRRRDGCTPSAPPPMTATVKSLDQPQPGACRRPASICTAVDHQRPSKLTFTSTNDGAEPDHHPGRPPRRRHSIAADIAEITVSAARSTARHGRTAATADAVSQTARSSLWLPSTTRSSTQIDQLAGLTLSYNGVNLLNGNNLKVVFNETSITRLPDDSGVTFNSEAVSV